MSASRSSPRSAVACGDLARVLDEARDVPRARARAARARCRSRARGRTSTLFCDARSLRTSSTSRSAGIGAADDLVDLLAAAGEAGAELAEDQREPLPVGQAHDVVDQVEVDRLRRCSRPAAGTGPCPRRGRSCAAPAAPRRRRRASASACTRRTSRRSATAGGPGSWASVRKSWYAGSWMSSTTDGLEVAGDVQRVDLADLDAGDLDVLAGDHEAGVVEDRAHLVGAAARRRPWSRTAAAATASSEEDGRDALHQGPGGTRLGSQSSGPRLPLSV